VRPNLIFGKSVELYMTNKIMNKYPKKIPKMLAWQFLGVLGRKS